MALDKVVVVTLSVCLLLSGEGGGAESDVDHQELLSPRFRQRLSSSLQHHAGEPLQVGHVTSGMLVPHACGSVTSVTLCCGFRVRRLGYYDHTQRQLGERALYVFPAKGDATRITCEGPEGVAVLLEDPVARKVKKIYTEKSRLRLLIRTETNWTFEPASSVVGEVPALTAGSTGIY